MPRVERAKKVYGKLSRRYTLVAVKYHSLPPTTRENPCGKMVGEMAIRFLGTSSQTGISRNYSSLLVKLDHHTVMVDCGESTQRQLQNRVGNEEKLSSIRNILITHMHADHVLGLVPLLCTLMGPRTAVGPAFVEQKPRVDIYGPSGLRALIRMTLTACYTTLSGFYTVHELLWPGQAPLPTSTSHDPSLIVEDSREELVGAVRGLARVLPNIPQHDNELPGRDILLDSESVTWPSFAQIGGVTVSAAPILHRCPALGYVFTEPMTSSQGLTVEAKAALDRNADALRDLQGIKNPSSLIGRLLRARETLTLPDGTILEPPALDVPGRKLVVLGDTSDATGGLGPSTRKGMLSLASDADVLVHESTNAALPGYLLSAKGRADERQADVEAKAISRGHSTPQMAGHFAARIGARQLLLNHFSIRYPAAAEYVSSRLENGMQRQVQNPDAERKWHVMREIERQATEAWHAGIQVAGTHDSHEISKIHSRRAVASFDGYVYRVPRATESVDEQIDASVMTSRSSQADEHAPFHHHHHHHHFNSQTNGAPSRGFPETRVRRGQAPARGQGRRGSRARGIGGA